MRMHLPPTYTYTYSHSSSPYARSPEPLLPYFDDCYELNNSSWSAISISSSMLSSSDSLSAYSQERWIHELSSQWAGLTNLQPQSHNPTLSSPNVGEGWMRCMDTSSYQNLRSSLSTYLVKNRPLLVDELKPAWVCMPMAQTWPSGESAKMGLPLMPFSVGTEWLMTSPETYLTIPLQCFLWTSISWSCICAQQCWLGQPMISTLLYCSISREPMRMQWAVTGSCSTIRHNSFRVGNCLSVYLALLIQIALQQFLVSALQSWCSSIGPCATAGMKMTSAAGMWYCQLKMACWQVSSSLGAISQPVEYWQTQVAPSGRVQVALSTPTAEQCWLLKSQAMRFDLPTTVNSYQQFLLFNFTLLQAKASIICMILSNLQHLMTDLTNMAVVTVITRIQSITINHFFQKQQTNLLHLLMLHLLMLHLLMLHLLMLPCICQIDRPALLLMWNSGAIGQHEYVYNQKQHQPALGSLQYIIVKYHKYHTNSSRGNSAQIFLVVLHDGHWVCSQQVLS